VRIRPHRRAAAVLSAAAGLGGIAASFSGRPDVLLAVVVAAAFFWGPVLPDVLRRRRSQRDAALDRRSLRRKMRVRAVLQILGGLALSAVYPVLWIINDTSASWRPRFRHDPTGQFIAAVASLVGAAAVVAAVADLLRDHDEGDI
jgi:hypothetical protein